MSQKLTKEQEALIPKYHAKWEKIAQSTTFDMPAAEAALRRCYDAGGLPQPRDIFYADDPVQGRDLWMEKSGQKNYSDAILYGSMEAGWLAYFDFMEEVVKEPQEPIILAFIELAKVSGWCFVHDEWAIITPKPATLRVDDRFRAHSLAGPALAYPGGKLVQHFIDGIPIPPEDYEGCRSWPVSKLLQYPNIEIRRCLIKLIGGAKLVKEAGKRIHSDDFGTLYEIEGAADGDTRFLVCHVVNGTPEPDGTYRDFFLMVHPELRPILNDRGDLGEPQKLTARNAVASTYSLRGEDYKPALRT
jgi:hypothetical protein